MPTAQGSTIRVVYNNLPKLPPELHKAAVDEIARSAFEVEAGAKAVVPVRTGLLRRSIHTVFELGGLRALVGPSVFYGVYVEFGTRHMAARPYMRPAAAKTLPRFIDRMKAIVRGLK